MIFYQPGFVCGNIMSRHQKKRNDNVNNFSLSHVVRPTSFRFSVFESVQFLFACFFHVVVFATFLDTHEAKINNLSSIKFLLSSYVWDLRT